MATSKKRAPANLAFPARGGAPDTLRTGKDMATRNAAQSGPNRGTNTGSASPGGIVASTKAGVAMRAGIRSKDGNRASPVKIPGASRGATTIDGKKVGHHG